MNENKSIKKTRESMDWFSEELEYSGRGVAKFEDPSGEFCGPTHVRVNTAGEVCIIMKVEENCIDKPECPSWPFFFYGKKSENDKGKLCWSIGGGLSNPCTSLTVELDSGRILNLQNVYDYSINDSNFNLFGRDDLETITLRPSQCVYEPSSEDKKKYWVLPLLNFAGFDTSFKSKHKDLESHPLRIRSDKGFIDFRYGETLAFIEGLPDYKIRMKRLDNGESKEVLTALMVGEVREDEQELHEENNILAMKLLSVLELAAGAPVGFPWIEYRSESGELVKRVHMKTRFPRFRRREKIIYDVHLGGLLTCASQHEEEIDVHIRIAIDRLLSSFQEIGLLSRSMTEVCSALDSLFKKYKIVAENLSHCLSESFQTIVKNDLKQVSKRIHELSKESFKAGDIEAADVLRSIGDRVLNADGKSGNFGATVSQLLDVHGFRDLEVLKEHYRAKYNQSWENRVSYFRTVGVHSSVLDQSRIDDEMDEMWHILRHLQDIVVRAILKTLKYEGPYSPITLTARGAEPVDWVNEKIQVSSLGF